MVWKSSILQTLTGVLSLGVAHVLHHGRICRSMRYTPWTSLKTIHVGSNVVSHDRKQGYRHSILTEVNHGGSRNLQWGWIANFYPNIIHSPISLSISWPAVNYLIKNDARSILCLISLSISWPAVTYLLQNGPDDDENLTRVRHLLAVAMTCRLFQSNVIKSSPGTDVKLI